MPENITLGSLDVIAAMVKLILSHFSNCSFSINMSDGDLFGPSGDTLAADLWVRATTVRPLTDKGPWQLQLSLSRPHVPVIRSCTKQSQSNTVLLRLVHSSVRGFNW